VAHTLPRTILTLGAGLTLLCSIVACGGRGAVPPAPGTNGALAQPPSLSAPSAPDAPKSADTTVVATTYDRIGPLAFTTDGTNLTFTTPITIPQVFTPLVTGPLVVQPLTIPLTCAPPGGVVSAGTERRSALATTAAASTSTVTPCLIAAYTYGSADAIPVSGYATTDGTNLTFTPLSPGPTYAAGTRYAFFIDYATNPATPDPCAGKTDNGNHYGNDDTRNQQDDGEHKDCGYHTGEGQNNP